MEHPSLSHGQGCCSGRIGGNKARSWLTKLPEQLFKTVPGVSTQQQQGAPEIPTLCCSPLPPSTIPVGRGEPWSQAEREKDPGCICAECSLSGTCRTSKSTSSGDRKGRRTVLRPHCQPGGKEAALLSKRGPEEKIPCCCSLLPSLGQLREEENPPVSAERAIWTSGCGPQVRCVCNREAG